ncbi:hypothetical protein GOP47_0012800 [Adiantum capillus-veneris]|uniref:Uncharacterized protein n=1 Tax=Adiantum capillus-veneris TaxID=13818 RepID=A0A9D4URC7_ADICA|nr:hypothetical protein GOP47_0012800 [Adiantum capillus-veneris]
MKKRHTPSRRGWAKKEGLDRLRAESRRFQDDLRCIRSSLSCPCRHSHADSSEESSENSAWDSPQTLKQLLATMPCITHKKRCEQSSPEADESTSSTAGMHTLADTRNVDACDSSACPRISHQVSACQQSVSNEHFNPSSVSVHHSPTYKKSMSHEYHVHSPSSGLFFEQPGSTGSCLPVSSIPVALAGEDPSDQEIIHNSTSIFGHHELAGRNVVRITATTVFTGNGGNLVLSAPRSFNDDRHSQQGSTTFLPCLDNGMRYGDHQEEKPSQTLTESNIDRNKSSHGRKGWKSMTTVSFGDKSTCICTESMMNEVEQNKGTQTRFPNSSTSNLATHQSDMQADHNFIANPQQKSSKSEEFSSVEPEKPNTIESNTLLHAAHTHSIEKFTKLKEAVSTSKDSILARRMASKIKFILRTLDVKRQAPYDALHIGSSHLPHYTQTRQSKSRGPQDIFSKKHIDDFCKEREPEKTDFQGLPHPESYLENVILALSLLKDEGHAKEPLQAIMLSNTNDTKSEDEIHSQKSTLETSLLDRICDAHKSTSVEKKDFGVDIYDETSAKNEQNDGVNEPCIQSVRQNVSNPSQEVVQASKSKENKGKGLVDDCFAEEHQTQGLAIGERPNVQDHAGPQSLPHRQCIRMFEEKPVSAHVEETTGKASVLGHNTPLVLETSTVISNTAHSDDSKQISIDPEQREPVKALTSVESVTHHEYAPNKLLIMHKSILDFPVEAAVVAANDLARHLAQGVPYKTPRGNAQQLASAQQERTRHATKAVQALIGEGFDYGSMYQDLKVLQGERRKLEMRAKTTVYFQPHPKDAQHIVKQDGFGGEHLLRRKAELADPLLSSLGSKRQRTTKSSVRDDRGKKTDSSDLRRNHYEKTADFPTFKSFSDVSMIGIPHNKDLQSTRFAVGNKERMDNALLNHIQRQRQFNAHKYLLESSVYVGVKRNHKGLPRWVDRLTQGNRTTNLNRFFMRESAAGLVTKNLIRRKSVRPPGAIFKASNPIQWTGKPFSLKDLSLQNKKSDKTERGKVSKLKQRVIISAHEAGQSNKSAQKMRVVDLHEELMNTKDRSISGDEPLKIEECQTGEEREKNNDFIIHETKNGTRLEENMPTRSEALNREDVNNGLPENIPGTSEQQLDNNEMAVDKIAEENRDEGSFNLEANNKTARPRSLWDADFLTQIGVDRSKKDSGNDVTQDDLLALTLRSILNSQPSSNNRIWDEANDTIYSGIDHSIDQSGPHLIEGDRKQNCKSVQTIENGPCVPSHLAVSSFPVVPALLLSNENVVVPPSIYMPCIHPSHSWMPIEQGHSCSTSDFPRKRQDSSANFSEKNRRKMKKSVKWSKRVYARDQESSSSTTTPSSPASIHEIDDMCETGWNHANEVISTDLQIPEAIADFSEKIEPKSSPADLRTISKSIEILEKPQETVDVEMRKCKEPPRVTHDVEEPDPFSKQVPVQTKIDRKSHVVEQKEAQTQPSQIEWPPDSLELSMVSERPRNTDFDSRIAVNQATETEKRLTLVPYKDHIYPSPQNSARTLAKTGIPSWALVVKPSSLPNFTKLPSVPSWSEIKRPMMLSSSSDTEEASTSDTSTSMGELHQKALTILRQSALTPLARGSGQRVTAKGDDTSEGEIETGSRLTKGAAGNVELGEIIRRKPSLSQPKDGHHRSSSDGEVSLGRLKIA